MISRMSLALTNRHLDHRDKWSARVHLHNRATHVHLQRLSRILDERGAHCLEFAANLLPSAAKPVAMEDVVVTVGTSHVVAVGRDLGVRELAPRHASSSRMLRFCRNVLVLVHPHTWLPSPETATEYLILPPI